MSDAIYTEIRVTVYVDDEVQKSKQQEAEKDYNVQHEETSTDILNVCKGEHSERICLPDHRPKSALKKHSNEKCDDNVLKRVRFDCNDHDNASSERSNNFKKRLKKLCVERRSYNRLLKYHSSTTVNGSSTDNQGDFRLHDFDATESNEIKKDGAELFMEIESKEEGKAKQQEVFQNSLPWNSCQKEVGKYNSCSSSPTKISFKEYRKRKQNCRIESSDLIVPKEREKVHTDIVRDIELKERRENNMSVELIDKTKRQRVHEDENEECRQETTQHITGPLFRVKQNPNKTALTNIKVSGIGQAEKHSEEPHNSNPETKTDKETLLNNAALFKNTKHDTLQHDIKFADNAMLFNDEDTTNGNGQLDNYCNTVLISNRNVDLQDIGTMYSETLQDKIRELAENIKKFAEKFSSPEKLLDDNIAKGQPVEEKTPKGYTLEQTLDVGSMDKSDAGVLRSIKEEQCTEKDKSLQLKNCCDFIDNSKVVLNTNGSKTDCSEQFNVTNALEYIEREINFDSKNSKPSLSKLNKEKDALNNDNSFTHKTEPRRSDNTETCFQFQQNPVKIKTSNCKNRQRMTARYPTTYKHHKLSPQLKRRTFYSDRRHGRHRSAVNNWHPNVAEIINQPAKIYSKYSNDYENGQNLDQVHNHTIDMIDYREDRKCCYLNCFHKIKGAAFTLLNNFLNRHFLRHNISLEEFEFDLSWHVRKNLNRYVFQGNNNITHFISHFAMINAILETMQQPDLWKGERLYRKFDRIIGYVTGGLPSNWCEVEFDGGHFVRARPVHDPESSLDGKAFYWKKRTCFT